MNKPFHELHLCSQHYVHSFLYCLSDSWFLTLPLGKWPQGQVVFFLLPSKYFFTLQRVLHSNSHLLHHMPVFNKTCPSQIVHFFLQRFSPHSDKTDGWKMPNKWGVGTYIDWQMLSRETLGLGPLTDIFQRNMGDHILYLINLKFQGWSYESRSIFFLNEWEFT